MPNFTFRLWLLMCLGLIASATQAQRIAANGQHTASIHADGTLWTWGDNYDGEAGTGTTTNQAVPVQVGTTTTWQAVAAGSYCTLAIRTNGTLWAWGSNTHGQLGTGTTASQSTPVQIGAATTWQSVAAGYGYTVAIRTDGTLWAWGLNNYGQLGDGTTTTQKSPVQIGSATNWRGLSANNYQTAAIRTDGTLWTWGYNYWGQLGTGTVGLSQLTPAPVAKGGVWQAVAVGYGHTVGQRADGSVWAWGYNGLGQLGNGTFTNQLAPGQIGAATTWKSVATGWFHTVAIRPNGTLWAWGDNTYGQLGDGTTTDQPVPKQIGTATNWQSVSVGDNYTLAIRTDGTLWAWGDNFYGELGLGTTTNQLTPTQVGTATDWQRIAAGQLHILALRTDGTLWAWGNNTYGQATGNGTTGAARLTPIQVGSSHWQSIAAGFYHSLAVNQNGTLWAWGYGQNGQLGTSAMPTSQASPVQVGSATTWQNVAAGQWHSLATRTDGTLWAWGLNNYGQLGLGSSAPSTQYTPALINSTATWQQVAAGHYYTVALRTDGSLWAWGENYDGQLGLGTTASQAAPRQLGSSTTWQFADAGGGHSAAIRRDGTLWTWGANDRGQLGNGIYANSSPTYVPDGGTPLATTAAYPLTGWQLAPNPAHGTVQVLGLPAGFIALRLFDAQGRLARTATSASVALDGLAPGLYLLRATAGTATHTLRLVVE